MLDTCRRGFVLLDTYLRRFVMFDTDSRRLVMLDTDLRRFVMLDTDLRRFVMLDTDLRRFVMLDTNWRRFVMLDIDWRRCISDRSVPMCRVVYSPVCAEFVSCHTILTMANFDMIQWWRAYSLQETVYPRYPHCEHRTRSGFRNAGSNSVVSEQYDGFGRPLRRGGDEGRIPQIPG